MWNPIQRVDDLFQFVMFWHFLSIHLMFKAKVFQKLRELFIFAVDVDLGVEIVGDSVSFRSWPFIVSILNVKISVHKATFLFPFYCQQLFWSSCHWHKAIDCILLLTSVN